MLLIFQEILYPHIPIPLRMSISSNLGWHLRYIFFATKRKLSKTKRILCLIGCQQNNSKTRFILFFKEEYKSSFGIIDVADKEISLMATSMIPIILLYFTISYS